MTVPSSTGAIPVYIRHADDAKGVLLCTWAIRELDELMKEIPRRGLYLTESGALADGDNLTGQFVLETSEAYFEIIVDLADE
jgi:hypothetical protein